MSVHDRAAARATPKITLTVSTHTRGCSQCREFPALSQRERDERIALERSCWPYPSLVGNDDYGPYYLAFDVEQV